jgi:heptosyltransferase-2
MNIVVRTPNWIGDAVLSLPAILSLQANYPEAEVWIAANAWVGELFSGEGFSGRLIPLVRFRDSARTLRRQEFEIGLLLPNSFSSALLFAMARIPQRWGYRRDGRGVLLTRGVSPKNPDPPRHQVATYLYLLEKLGLRTLPPDVRMDISFEEKERARKKLAEAGVNLAKPLVIVNPGAAYGSAKRWSAAKFASLVRLFADKRNAAVVVTGAPEDRAIGETISAPLPKKAVNLAGQTTLRELLGFISLASVFVTNDTGPMHMANALRIPVIALFGPTDPRVTAPFHPPASVIKKDVVCWPCLYRDCPYDHRCMELISPGEVFEAAAAYLP